MKKILSCISILLSMSLFASCSNKTNNDGSKTVNTASEKVEIAKQVPTENCYPNTNVPDFGKFFDSPPIYDSGKHESGIGHYYHYYEETLLGGVVDTEDLNRYFDILTNEYNFSFVEKSGENSRYSNYTVTFTNSKEYVGVTKLSDHNGLYIQILTPEDLIKMETTDDYKYKLY